MHRLTQPPDARHRQWRPHAAQQRPAQRLLAPGPSRRRAERQARRLRAQLEKQATHAQ